MSQAAVFITCQMPLKSGLPSRVRGSGLPGVWASATDTAATKKTTIEIRVAEAGRRYGMAAAVLYTRCVHRRQRADKRRDALDGCGCRGSCTADRLCNTRINLPRVQLEDLLLVTGIERRDLVDVPFGVVEIMAGLGIDPAHGTHHLGPKQNIV